MSKYNRNCKKRNKHLLQIVTNLKSINAIYYTMHVHFLIHKSNILSLKRINHYLLTYFKNQKNKLLLRPHKKHIWKAKINLFSLLNEIICFPWNKDFLFEKPVFETFINLPLFSNKMLSYEFDDGKARLFY